MSNYLKIKVPFLSENEIANIANNFRDKYHGGKSSPINVIDILEFDLGIKIIPSPGLESRCNTDAFITRSWENILVDQRKLDNEAYDKRLNFSLAHELGHYILHKDLYELLEIEDIEDFYKIIECPSGIYKRIEAQANMFAGRLLVPAEELKIEINKLTDKIKQGIIEVENFGNFLSDKFMASKDAIIIRIMQENISIDEEIKKYFLSN